MQCCRCCSSPRLQPPPAQPNIVYILCDDLVMGCALFLNPQRGKIATPQLDGMASQGMIFTDAHSSSSVCTPTRYGSTGRYNWRTPLQSGVLNGHVEPLIAADRLTCPGYSSRTATTRRSLASGTWASPWENEATEDGGTATGDDKKVGRKAKREAKREAKERRRLGKGREPTAGAITHDGPVTWCFDVTDGFHHARIMKSVFENDRVVEIIEPVDMLPRLGQRATEHIACGKAGQPFFLYLCAELTTYTDRSEQGMEGQKWSWFLWRLCHGGGLGRG